MRVSASNLGHFILLDILQTYPQKDTFLFLSNESIISITKWKPYFNLQTAKATCKKLKSWDEVG